MKKKLIAVCIGILIGTLGILCSVVFSNPEKLPFVDLSFYIGLGLLIFGLFSSQKGDPVLNPPGGKGSVAQIHFLASVASEDSKRHSPSDALQNRVLELRPTTISLLLAALMVFLALGISYLIP